MLGLKLNNVCKGDPGDSIGDKSTLIRVTSWVTAMLTYARLFGHYFEAQSCLRLCHDLQPVWLFIYKHTTDQTLWLMRNLIPYRVNKPHCIAEQHPCYELTRCHQSWANKIDHQPPACKLGLVQRVSSPSKSSASSSPAATASQSPSSNKWCLNEGYKIHWNSVASKSMRS